MAGFPTNDPNGPQIPARGGTPPLRKVLERVLRAVQGNFDHWDNTIREVNRKHNNLDDNVQALVAYVNEHLGPIAESAFTSSTGGGGGAGGTAGSRGSPGLDGLQGDSGVPGEAGPPGPQGPPGDPGAPGTPGAPGSTSGGSTPGSIGSIGESSEDDWPWPHA